MHSEDVLCGYIILGSNEIEAMKVCIYLGQMGNICWGMKADILKRIKSGWKTFGMRPCIPIFSRATFCQSRYCKVKHGLPKKEKEQWEVTIQGTMEKFIHRHFKSEIIWGWREEHIKSEVVWEQSEECDHRVMKAEVSLARFTDNRWNRVVVKLYLWQKIVTWKISLKW